MGDLLNQDISFRSLLAILVVTITTTISVCILVKNLESDMLIKEITHKVETKYKQEELAQMQDQLDRIESRVILFSEEVRRLQDFHKGE